MEPMSNAPYVAPDARWGARIGNATLIDAMNHDGLWCAFDNCTMGESSDRTNRTLGISRQEQDDWSAQSHHRAAEASASGHFAKEIAPVPVPQRKGDPVMITADEGIRPDTTAASLAALKPAFQSDGTITAGNASQISDGAAALVLANSEAATAAGLPVLATIRGYGQIGGPDASLHDRPAEALRLALKRAGMSALDLDLVEINEAFAAVALWSARSLDLDAARVNVNGGAVALVVAKHRRSHRGHLINAFQARGGGIAPRGGGGGQGDALIVEVAG
jgi:acetyl-CoA C-acetyltransferase